VTASAARQCHPSWQGVGIGRDAEPSSQTKPGSDRFKYKPVATVCQALGGQASPASHAQDLQQHCFHWPLHLTGAANCVTIHSKAAKMPWANSPPRPGTCFGGVFVVGFTPTIVPMGGRGTAMSSRVTGTVEWFDGSKGFGYIQADGLGRVFVHYLAITDNGIRHLRAGEKVEFSVKESPRGPEAVELVRL